MLKSCIKRLTWATILAVIVIYRGFSMDDMDQPIRFMFYNVENLFDIHKDSSRNDEEFLPGGMRRWNSTRYNRKINMLYKTIVAAGEWSPPAVVAFCEIENRGVLEDLIYGTYLSKYNYRIIHEESPDPRGIDVCLIYKKDSVEVVEYNYWIPAVSGIENFDTRSVLYAKLKIRSDTLHFIVNHWPSRRGGVLATENLRRQIAFMVKTKVDSLIETTKAEKRIILMGDFNCSPDDKAIQLLSDKNSSCSLLNISEKLADKGFGTYRYMGVWEMIDQVLVSEEFLTVKNGLYTDFELFNIFKPDFLLSKDPRYPGFTPFSTYRGFRYQGGYSDHLPVLIDLKYRDHVLQE